MDVMIDLETLDTGPHAVVLSFGAVAFNLNEEDNWDDMKEDHQDRLFYARLNIGEQIHATRTVSGSTIEWWMSQGAQARQVFSEKRVMLNNFFVGFTNWYRHAGQSGDVWSNGPSFDNVIIRTLFEDFGRECPFPYYADRDFRTIRALAGDPAYCKPHGMVAHNALDDALAQALKVQFYAKTIRSR